MMIRDALLMSFVLTRPCHTAQQQRSRADTDDVSDSAQATSTSRCAHHPHASKAFGCNGVVAMARIGGQQGGSSWARREAANGGREEGTGRGNRTMAATEEIQHADAASSRDEHCLTLFQRALTWLVELRRVRGACGLSAVLAYHGGGGRERGGCRCSTVVESTQQQR